MKSFFQLKKFIGIAAAASVAAGAITFMTIGVLADEAVSYYGLSENGNEIKGTVTDYTKITESDTSWGVAGSETWYVASDRLIIDNNSSVVINGDVNIILKDGAEVVVEGGVYGDNASLAFYSETENGSGIMAFIGKQGDQGANGGFYSGSSAADGDDGKTGYTAVDIAKLTVSGGTVTAVGGKGGNGGPAGYGEYDSGERYYGVGGNGGKGAKAISDDTKVYLYGGTFNATAGRGGDAGANNYAPSSEQDRYVGQTGESGTKLKGVYAVNGTLNVNKLDDSDINDTSGDYELYSVEMYSGSKLKLVGLGKATVARGTEIKSYGDIEVSGELFVDDNGKIFTNGNITAVDNGKMTKTSDATVKRITPVDGEGYTFDYQEGFVDTIDGYYMNGSSDGQAWRGATVETIIDNNNKFSITHLGNEFIDDSDFIWFYVPYVVVNNSSSYVKPVDFDVFNYAGDNIQLNFELEQPDDYVFSGVVVTDGKGTAIASNKYKFDTSTGIFKADSIACNMFIEVQTQAKSVAIELIGENDASISTADLGEEYDNGSPQSSLTLKVKVTEGGSITKYKVIKESDFSKNTFEAAADTSNFIVNYTNGSTWGNADDSSAKISLDETVSFTIKPKSRLKAGVYTESYIVVTDKTVFGDILNNTPDQALVRFTVTYNVGHESDGQLSFTDLTEHYNICRNCLKKLNKTAHTFDVQTVSEDTLAKSAGCTKPAEYYYSCECGAHTDNASLTFEYGNPNGHSFGDWSVSKKSTCVAGGEKTRECEICSYTEYDDTDIDPNGHKWEDSYTIDREPTCTTEGSKSIHCSLCDATKDSQAIPVTAHTYGDWTVTREATCTVDGEKMHKCTFCGFEQTDVIKAEHDWEDDRTVDISPTCTEDGEDSVHCKKCDERKEIGRVSATGHDFSDWTVTKEATCTVDGEKMRKCKLCDIEQTEVIKAEHDWEDSRTVDIQPTCAEDGEESVHCKKCDERKDICKLSAIEHVWSEWTVTVEPTADSEGKEERICKTCKAKEERTVDKLKANNEWHYDDKNHWHKDDKGNIIDLEEHEFKWVVDKEPTDTEPGMGHYECISCAFEQAPEEFEKRNPETGSGSLVLWSATVLIAGTTATMTLRTRKKKSK